MTAPFESQQFIARHVRDIPRSGIREFFDIVQTMPDVISLGVGEPDFVTPWHIREAAIYALERGKTTYTSNLGLLKLREAISAYVARKFGVRYDPKTQILVAVGVSEALDIALRAVVNPGDEVLYHEPCYVSYSPSITLTHGVAVPVPLEADRLVEAKKTFQGVLARSPGNAEAQEGLVAVANGKVMASVPLPVAGLMSESPVSRVHEQMETLKQSARGLGCRLPDPFMTLSFLSLPVIPELKLTDQGLVDVKAMSKVPLFL